MGRLARAVLPTRYFDFTIQPRSMCYPALILVIGSMPPPVHGASKNNALMAEYFRRRGCQVKVANTSSGEQRARSWAAKRRKAVRFFLATWQIIASTVHRKGDRAARKLYITIDGGHGLIGSFLNVAVARLLRWTIFVQHRSFAYIDRPNRWVAGLVACAGSNASHIFLCTRMREGFQCLYPKARNSRILSNACYIRPIDSLEKRLPGRFRLGHLSNLCPEKGFLTVIALLEELLAKGQDVELHLAGQPFTETDQMLVDAACAKLRDRLIYAGPVYNEAKTAFLRRIDLFVFPTRYDNEAQPKVLFEAMQYGVPCISYARGCIEDDLFGGGYVIPRDEDFVRCALPLVMRTIEDSSGIASAALARARELRNVAELQFSSLLDEICGR